MSEGPTSKPGERRRKLEALTGLRFVAAGHVVLFHLGRGLLSGAPAPVRGIVGSGYAGVTLFYLLSGFILAYNYLDNEATGIPKVKFWEARFARVFPVYAFALLVALPIGLQTMHQRAVLPEHPATALGIAGLNIALLQSWWPTTSISWNPPGWSLSNEAFFYLLFPVVAVAFLRLKGRSLAIVGAALWIAALAAPIAYLLLNPDGIGTGNPESEAFWLSAVKYNPLTRLPEFLMGVAMGIYFLRRGKLSEQAKEREGWLSVLACALVIGVFAASTFIPYPLMHNGIAAPLFALLILTLASDTGPVAWLLSRPVAILLGEASYALYLLHFPLIDWVNRGGKAIGAPHMAVVGVGIVVLLVVPVIVLKTIEEPARRALRRRSGIAPALPRI